MEKILSIVTGPERNGTTYLSKLLCSIPDIYCGFETGLLLDNDFKKCEPFNKWIHHGNEHWGCPNNIDFYDKKLTFDDKYKLLFNNKGSYNELNIHQKLITKSKFIIDKTPKYIRNLQFVRKNSKEVPILISIKYLKDYYISMCVKRNTDINKFEELYLKNIETLEWIKKEKPKHIYLFLYNDIIKQSFGNKLKNILSSKIDLTNVNISYENFKKKILTKKYAYSDWTETPKYNINVPIDNEITKKYDTLIDELNYVFPE